MRRKKLCLNLARYLYVLSVLLVCGTYYSTSMYFLKLGLLEHFDTIQSGAANCVSQKNAESSQRIWAPAADV
jgi:hypothetical protein